ncbi:hypothetical protein FCV25MIE_14496 [Fagus crenata]
MFRFGYECSQGYTLTNLATRRTLKSNTLYTYYTVVFMELPSSAGEGVTPPAALGMGSLDPPASRGPKLQTHLSRLLMSHSSLALPKKVKMGTLHEGDEHMKRC